MTNITIPENWFEGHDCLDLGIPWQVPESIFKEDENVSKDNVAMEFGTGGSTIFLAQRCLGVVAVETSHEWASKVIKKIGENGLVNVDYSIYTDENDIIKFIENYDTRNISILSVDTQGGYNRSAILDAFLSKGIHDRLKMVIIDNYSHEGLFPNHHNKNIMPDWDMFTYDCDRYAGNGTRLYIKKQI